MKFIIICFKCQHMSDQIPMLPDAAVYTIVAQHIRLGVLRSLLRCIQSQAGFEDFGSKVILTGSP